MIDQITVEQSAEPVVHLSRQTIDTDTILDLSSASNTVPS